MPTPEELAYEQLKEIATAMNEQFGFAMHGIRIQLINDEGELTHQHSFKKIPQQENNNDENPE